MASIAAGATARLPPAASSTTTLIYPSFPSHRPYAAADAALHLVLVVVGNLPLRSDCLSCIEDDLFVRTHKKSRGRMSCIKSKASLAIYLVVVVCRRSSARGVLWLFTNTWLTWTHVRRVDDEWLSGDDQTLIEFED